MSQLFNFQILVSNSINLGIPLGLTAKVSELYGSKNDGYVNKINSYWFFFFKLILIFSFTSTLILVLFSDSITNLLVGSSEHKIIFSIIILAVPFSAAYVLIDSFLKSFGAISTIVKVSIISSLMGIAVLTPLVIYFNVVGVAVNILVMAMLPIAVFVLFFRKKFAEFFKFSNLVKLSFSEKKDVIKIGFVSLMATLMHQGAIITIRRFVIDEFGEIDNGIYQSVLGISLNYFAIIYAILANYTLPKFSSLKDNISLNSEINDNFRFLMIIIIPSVLLIFSYRDIVLQIIYTGEFSKAADLFLFQMIGDIFRMMAALFGLWLIPRMKILPLVSIDFIFNLTLVTLPFILINFYKHDLNVIPFCYMIAFFIHFSLFFLYTKKKLKFNFKIENKKIIYYGITIILVGFAISNLFISYGHFVVLVLIVVWLLTVFSKEEKNKILSKLSEFRFFKK